MPDAQGVAAFTTAVAPLVVWVFLAGSLVGGGYAFRLWRRARADVAAQRAAGINGALRYSAMGNLRRVRLRLYMFLDCLGLAVCALVLPLLPRATLERALLSLGYVLLFPVLIGILVHQSRSDEQHDQVLRRLLALQARQRVVSDHEVTR